MRWCLQPRVHARRWAPKEEMPILELAIECKTMRFTRSACTAKDVLSVYERNVHLYAPSTGITPNQSGNDVSQCNCSHIVANIIYLIICVGCA